MHHTGTAERRSRIALALLLVLSHPVWAATIIVDETTCTLVDAVDSANTDTAVGGCTAGSGPDTIELTTDVTLTTLNNSYHGGNALPVVASEIAVLGEGRTIARGSSSEVYRLFAVESSGTITLNDVTLDYGLANFGGIIWNGGTATLDHVTVQDGYAYSWGGGIWNEGTLVLTNSTVSDHFAWYVGGIANLGSATLTDSAVSGNAVAYGFVGGIYNGADGELTLTNSDVSGNGAPESGGIGNAGIATLTNSTVSGNSTGNIGAAGISNGGTLTLTNTTVSGNTTTGACGGICNGGTVTLTNSTISGNSAGHTVAGLQNIGTGTITLTNSIVANSPSGGNCDGDFIVDNGNNFADDDSCGAGFAAITPGLDFDVTLADNGGPTLTHALLPGSVAQDAAGACGLATDQRGASRDDGACDSGSFELAPAVPASSPTGLLLLGAGLIVALLTLATRARRRRRIS